MQQKGLLSQKVEVLTRLQKAATNAEKRQDADLSMPADFLRHWADCEGRPVEKKLLLCQASQKHFERGTCCLPACLVWRWSLSLAKRLMVLWKKEEPEEARLAALEQALAAATAQQAKDWGVDDWTAEDWAAYYSQANPESTQQGATPELDSSAGSAADLGFTVADSQGTGGMAPPTPKAASEPPRAAKAASQPPTATRAPSRPPPGATAASQVPLQSQPQQGSAASSSASTGSSFAPPGQ